MRATRASDLESAHQMPHRCIDGRMPKVPQNYKHRQPLRASVTGHTLTTDASFGCMLHWAMKPPSSSSIGRMSVDRITGLSLPARLARRRCSRVVNFSNRGPRALATMCSGIVRLADAQRSDSCATALMTCRATVQSNATLTTNFS